MSLGVPNIQGELDGLCGIYALTNFLRDLRFGNRYFAVGDENSRSGDAFWMLLDAAYRLNMFTPDYLIEGYAPHQLAKLWNCLAEEADLQCSAVLFSKLKRLGRRLTVSRIAECVYGEPLTNALVVNWQAHWYLSTGYNPSGSIDVFDSSAGRSKKRMSRAQLDERATDGFALLRNGSKILQCVRQEIDG